MDGLVLFPGTEKAGHVTQVLCGRVSGDLLPAARKVPAGDDLAPDPSSARPSGSFYTCEGKSFSCCWEKASDVRPALNLENLGAGASRTAFASRNVAEPQKQDYQARVR